MSAVNINLNNFRQEVLNTDKKVLLDFWAPWCGPCRMVVPMVEAIAEERPDIKVGKINIDEQFELANQFGIMSIPTLLVMKDGKIIRKATGARPKQAILEMLQTDGPFLLEACVVEEGNVLPMTPPGGTVDEMLLEC